MFGWLAQLLGLGSPSPERRLQKQAHDIEPEQRRRAAEQLGTVNEPWANDVLLALLKDMIPEVRDAAREALRKHGPGAVRVLLLALEHAEPKVAVPAADMLAELKAPDAIRPLLLVMKFGSVEIRAAAIRALIRYGAAAVPALELAQQDPDPWTRRRSEEILADIRAALPPPAPAPPEPVPAAMPPAEGAGEPAALRPTDRPTETP
jgi:HEAT repeat protein